MKKEVKLYRCDRCGCQEFFELEHREMRSGGFEPSWAKYKDAVGWGSADQKDLCPKCSAALKNTVQAFMKAVVADE